MVVALFLVSDARAADDQPDAAPGDHEELTAGQQPVAEQSRSFDWSSRFRLGMEYDNNPYRLEDPDDDADVLTRYLVAADVSHRIEEALRLGATLRHGATLFRREADAAAMVTSVHTTASWRPARWVYVQPLADVKDRTEADSRRDYVRGGAMLRVGANFGPVQPWVDAGGRFFAYKPSPPSSHRGPQLRAGLRFTPRRDTAIDAMFQRSDRAFSTIAWDRRDDRFVPVDDETTRRDTYHSGRLAVAYRRGFAARARYLYARNNSNSYGQQMTRHALEASLTVPVVWQIFLSVRGEIQRTRYRDPVAIDDVFTLDEEHRNTLVTALSRPIAEGWQLEFRHSLYLQEFGVGGEYFRQVFGVAIGVDLDEFYD